MAEDKKDADDAQPGPEDGAAPEADPDDELTVDDILAAASDDGQAADDAVLVLQATLEERTRDLQRITAEFQNYRKRVERDKARAGELATAGVLQSLLPVLDDLDRAREHGDLNGPFGSVADQLVNALTKQGLEAFGVKGDPFDPQIHEAVAHMQMPDVDGPTCIDVMRSGYRLGDKLLRPALVAVAEPSDEPAPAAEPEDAADDSAGDTAGDTPGDLAEDASEAAETGQAEAEAAADGGDPAEATAEDAVETGSGDAPEAEPAADAEPEASEDAAPERRKKKRDKGKDA
ncbi:Molecular chaperone GrpE (heat shock protein) [Glycomyces sambucus]|uniref:Protein GrpE n=1 Tax=Glycomyces sambucus TaxID=380244 RepID=A0A1G9H721_9ACTN|nr:nucleotide exchange factor GrpE [Glycomyces sambucus]SDL08727.1 Molecular chaperone GrpE (heat shock protein) [Glycomyces sambucus]